MENQRSSARSRAGKSPRKDHWRVAGMLLFMMMTACFNTACSSGSKGAPAADSAAGPVRYIVTADSTAFYKYGPAQANGADMQLKKGQEVLMLDRHYGYSRVQTDDGLAGYIGTDDIAPSPHTAALAQAPVKKTGGGSRGGRSPDFEQPNDAALPSAQPPSDEPVPSFRY